MAVRREKPDSASETARVLRVFDMLVEELRRRFSSPMSPVVYDMPDILAVADRICARSEDPA